MRSPSAANEAKLTHPALWVALYNIYFQAQPRLHLDDQFAVALHYTQKMEQWHLPCVELVVSLVGEMYRG